MQQVFKETLELENIETLLEEFDAEEFPGKQSTEVDIFQGRFNPPHLGHKAIFDMMRNPLVVLVKGEKSSQDKEKNPLPMDYQLELLNKLVNGRVITNPSGNLFQIIEKARNSGLEPRVIYAGSDRFDRYRKMVDSLNSKLPEEKKVDVGFEETPRVTSATKVRESLKKDNFEDFKENMPKEFWSEYEKMKSFVK